MQTVILLIIGLGVLLLLLIITGLVLIKKIGNKTKIQINIILKSKHIDRFKIKLRRLPEGITRNNRRYIFDDEAVIKGKYIDNVYYYEDNPQPIIYDFKANIPGTKAKDLQTLLETDLITKLFKETLLENMYILIIIILVISALSLIAGGIGAFKKGVTLLDNEENRLLIKDVVLQAIKGG
jgi:hypothetical protein